MNQQRSRRFRSAQEAREKYGARLEAEAEWKGALYSPIRRESALTFCSSNGQADYLGSERVLGLQRDHAWHAFHGTSRQLAAILGSPKA